MKINTRFTVAIHIMALIELSEYKDIICSSEKLALSVNTNPVVIRKLLPQLKKAGLIETKHGVVDAKLTRKPSEITMLDIYNAIKKSDDMLFNIHQDTNQQCYVGANIHDAVSPILDRVQDAIEVNLSSITLETVIEPIADKNQIKLNK